MKTNLWLTVITIALVLNAATMYNSAKGANPDNWQGAAPSPSL